MMIVKQNPNNKYAQKIKDRLKQNDGYCPCCIEKSPDTKCMCKEFREQIDRREPGECHCGLYEIVVTESE